MNNCGEIFILNMKESVYPKKGSSIQIAVFDSKWSILYYVIINSINVYCPHTTIFFSKSSLIFYENSIKSRFFSHSTALSIWEKSRWSFFSWLESRRKFNISLENANFMFLQWFCICLLGFCWVVIVDFSFTIIYKTAFFKSPCLFCFIFLNS